MIHSETGLMALIGNCNCSVTSLTKQEEKNGAELYQTGIYRQR